MREQGGYNVDPDCGVPGVRLGQLHEVFESTKFSHTHAYTLERDPTVP